MGGEHFHNPGAGAHPTHSRLFGPQLPGSTVYDGVKAMRSSPRVDPMSHGQWQRRSVAPFAGENYELAYRVNKEYRRSTFPPSARPSQLSTDLGVPEEQLDYIMYKNTRTWLPTQQTTSGAIKLVKGEVQLTSEAIRVPAAIHMVTSPEIHVANAENAENLALKQEGEVEEAQRKYDDAKRRQLCGLPPLTQFVLNNPDAAAAKINNKFNGVTSNALYGQHMPLLVLDNVNSTFGSRTTFSDSLPVIVPLDDLDEEDEEGLLDAELGLESQDAQGLTQEQLQATFEGTAAVAAEPFPQILDETSYQRTMQYSTMRPFTPPPPTSRFEATKPLDSSFVGTDGRPGTTRQYLTRPPRMQSLVARSLLSPTFSRRNNGRNSHTSIF